MKVTDTLSKKYPYGKQCKDRGGMWYTPVSGIYKTVWIENVNDKYIEKITITSDLKGIDLTVHGDIDKFNVIIEDDDKKNIYESFGNSLRIDIDNPKIWDCENPYLY